MTTKPLRATIGAVGDDEARARATLNEMQLRISDGPYAALGIPVTASVDEVRSAFLALTKQFHPARFARMAPDVHRLSNEVFIGIKAAHDQLVKLLGGPARVSPSGSGAIPVIQPEGTGRAGTRPVGTAPAPIRPTVTPTGRPPERGQPVVSRTATPQTPLQGVPTRPATPPSAARSGTQPVAAIPPHGMAPRPGAQPAQPVRPTTPANRTPPMGTPIMRPGTPPTTRAATPPGVRPATPQTARPASPPAPSNYNPETIRHSGAPAFDERTANREAMIQLNEQDWSGARQTLQSLATHRPQSRNYGALLAYARGREAQKLGRAGEAALEVQRALELEPDLAMAKQALAEVQRRR